MRRPTLIARLCLLAAVGGAACGTVEPRVTQRAAVPLASQPRLFVSSLRQRDEVAAALVHAGLDITSTTPADYVLAVDVGAARSTQPCGALANVRYQLLSIAPPDSREPLRVADDLGAMRERGRALVIVGRGWSGSCQPNIHDQMSRVLARELGVAAAAP